MPLVRNPATGMVEYWPDQPASPSVSMINPSQSPTMVTPSGQAVTYPNTDIPVQVNPQLEAVNLPIIGYEDPNAQQSVLFKKPMTQEQFKEFYSSFVSSIKPEEKIFSSPFLGFPTVPGFHMTTPELRLRDYQSTAPEAVDRFGTFGKSFWELQSESLHKTTGIDFGGESYFSIAQKKSMANLPKPSPVDELGAGIIIGGGLALGSAVFPPLAFGLGAYGAWNIGSTIGTSIKEQSTEPLINYGKSILEPTNMGMIIGGSMVSFGVAAPKIENWIKGRPLGLKYGERITPLEVSESNSFMKGWLDMESGKVRYAGLTSGEGGQFYRRGVSGGEIPGIGRMLISDTSKEWSPSTDIFFGGTKEKPIAGVTASVYTKSGETGFIFHSATYGIEVEKGWFGRIKVKDMFSLTGGKSTMMGEPFVTAEKEIGGKTFLEMQYDYATGGLSFGERGFKLGFDLSKSRIWQEASMSGGGGMASRYMPPASFSGLGSSEGSSLFASPFLSMSAIPGIFSETKERTGLSESSYSMTRSAQKKSQGIFGGALTPLFSEGIDTDQKEKTSTGLLTPTMTAVSSKTDMMKATVKATAHPTQLAYTVPNFPKASAPANIAPPSFRFPDYLGGSRKASYKYKQPLGYTPSLVGMMMYKPIRHAPKKSAGFEPRPFLVKPSKSRKKIFGF